MEKLPLIDLEQTGRNIRRVRQEADMSIETLQQIFGFKHPTAIYRWEEGRTMPSIDNLVILAFVLGASVDELIATI